jgi:hypothetical protein
MLLQHKVSNGSRDSGGVKTVSLLDLPNYGDVRGIALVTLTSGDRSRLVGGGGGGWCRRLGALRLGLLLLG